MDRSLPVVVRGVAMQTVYDQIGQQPDVSATATPESEIAAFETWWQANSVGIIKATALAGESEAADAEHRLLRMEVKDIKDAFEKKPYKKAEELLTGDRPSRP